MITIVLPEKANSLVVGVIKDSKYTLWQTDIPRGDKFDKLPKFGKVTRTGASICLLQYSQNPQTTNFEDLLYFLEAQ